MAHLSKGDYLSNYFHDTYHRYLPALTNAFTFRKNICAKKITVSVNRGGSWSACFAMNITERGVLRLWPLS